VLAAAACLTTVGAAAVFGSTSAAQTSGGTRPVITGDPVVGNTLLVTPSATGHAIYQWQGCDPDFFNCADSPNKVDPNWFDLTRQSHANTSYTVPPSAAGLFIRALVHDNNEGDKWVTSAPVGPVPEQPPPPPAAVTSQEQPVEPEHGVSLLVQPTGGSILIQLPGQSGFVPLTGLEKIPVNSVLDTRGGNVQVIAATGNLGDKSEDNSVQFFGGIIRIEQSGALNAPATAKLVQKLKCAKGAKASKASGPLAASSKGRSRRVWGSGHGSYGTAGSGGTGSVRGTTWLTKDTCKGTFFKVTEGIGITVFDFHLGKSFELGPGQSHFAKKP
jgi:hypothetical protein